MQLGWPLPKRKEWIQRLKSEPAKRLDSIFFQGRLQDLSVHTVPIEFPKYRLDNGRTRSAQAEWLATHPDLPKDLFTADLESDRAQVDQHKILSKMLGRGEKELLKYFTKHDQSDRLILTELGFVLNGNRRLCAMRQLIEQDKTTHGPRFAHVNVIILPPATDLDLDRLEARLQISEDIKAEYSWTAKAFMLRTRRDEHRFDEKELSALYDIPKSEITDLLDMLSLGEAYLEDRGKARQFGLIDKSEFAFRQLNKNRGKLNTEQKKEIFEKLSYCFIDDAGEGRVYATIPDIAKHFDKILSNIHQQFPSESIPTTGSAAEILGVGHVDLDPALNIVDDEKNFEKVREVAAETIESEKLQEKEQSRGTKVISALKKSSESLAIALSDWKNAKSKKEIAEVAIVLEQQIKELRAKIDADSKN